MNKFTIASIITEAVVLIAFLYCVLKILNSLVNHVARVQIQSFTSLQNIVGACKSNLENTMG